MPASGFSPNWPTWPPPAPDPPTPDHVPVHHNSSGCPIHSLHHHQLPPTSDQLLVQAAPQPTATESTTAILTERPTTLPWIPPSKMANVGVAAGLIEMEPSEVARTAGNSHVLCPGLKGADKIGSDRHPTTPDFMGQGGDLSKGNGAGGEPISNEKFVQGQASHDEQQAYHRISFNNIQAPAHVAPQVFGAMPTSRSGYDYCLGHHNISLNTCVLDRNGNLSEQNIDGMPQAYGFHNLNCKSVVPEPMFAVYDESDSSSTESVPLFERLPMFDVYDEEVS